MTTRPATDRSAGLAIAFTVAAVLGALATASFGYRSALAHEGASTAQTLSGVGFGIAVLLGVLGIVLLHVHAE